ncbi:methionine ABC transporter ATP-binding protein [Pararhodospirillum photometricum]|uniref:methionine ABC transporter ATP-binding protein n=1 Tax=Pararhodospirillum photometricum TaxID=1084 RepID=UPI00059FFB23|nr:methionine ABC transporter ATP-binding protein [Pararhodospirillum photometricum]
MIVTESLTKIFPGPQGPSEVLRGISLNIGKGEVFGIIGRSGAGKSTLVRCLNLLERPTSGKVWIGDQEMTALTEAELRRARHSIGMIFQHFNLLSSRTAAENIALPLELIGMPRPEIQARVSELLDLVGLRERAGAYPAALSGGQKQRVGIARALASKPSVLLCDEATSALDPETTKSILSLLKDINRSLGLTIVLITHEMPVVKEIADRVAVLDRGEVVEQGRIFDVFTQPRHAVSRAFVQEVLNRDLPEILLPRLAPPGTREPSTPVIWRITFTGPSANEPILSDLVRHFDLSFNILHGHIDYIQGLPFGTLVVEAHGPVAARDAALATLAQKNLTAEVLGHVADTAAAAA